MTSYTTRQSSSHQSSAFKDNSLYHTSVHYTTLHYTTLHYTTLHHCTTLHPYLNKKYNEHHHINEKGRAHSQATDVIIKRKIIVKNKVATFG